MKKIIYWIDDSMEQMFYVMQGTFHKLWNLKEESRDYLNGEKIRSKILVLGNAYRQNLIDPLPTNQKDAYWMQKVDDFFYELCEDIEGPSDEHLYKNNKALICDMITFLFKEESNDEKVKLYEQIKGEWGNEEREGNNSELIEKLITLMKEEGVKEGDIVGIDLTLLNNDRHKVIDYKHKILSMELFFHLQEMNCKCFLYTTFEQNDSFINAWKNIYKEKYSDNKIEIYGRSKLKETGDDDFIKKIATLLLNGNK